MGAKKSQDPETLTLTPYEFSRAVIEELSEYYSSASFGGLVRQEAEIVAMRAWERALLAQSH
jgi:hypothetical protein